jgi:hypothetical protein
LPRNPPYVVWGSWRRCWRLFEFKLSTENKGAPLCFAVFVIGFSMLLVGITVSAKLCFVVKVCAFFTAEVEAILFHFFEKAFGDRSVKAGDGSQFAQEAASSSGWVMARV